jgi:putative zinc finger protein
MKPLTCTAVRRRLHGFYDGELAVADQIRVEAHLDWCDTCAATLAEFREVGSALRGLTPGRVALSHEEAGALTAAIVTRRKAEQDASLLARIEDIFDDMHLVYAGFGAAVATAICVVIVLGMIRFATKERPDSLAAMVDLLAAPEASANTIAIDAASHQRWTERFQAANESAEEDAVFALASVITRDGHLANFRGLQTNRNRREEAVLIDALSDAVAKARIESGSIDATEAAANAMVWLVTRTTVRATRVLGVDLPLPPAAKKRTASLAIASAVRT